MPGHTGHRAARGGDPVHPAIGEEPGTPGQRPGHAGHQHRPLRAGRAAAAAVAGARAVQLVPPVRHHGPAPGLCAGLKQRGVSPDRLRVLQADREPGLDRGEVGVEVMLADRPQALLLGPPAEHAGRRPPGHAPVHHGRPADAAALGVQHGRAADRHPAPAVAVQRAQRPPGPGGERFGRVVAAFLQQDHVHPGLGQFRGHGRAARTRPDDHRPAVQAQGVCHVRLRDQPADHGVPRSGASCPGAPVTAASPARMSGP